MRVALLIAAFLAAPVFADDVAIDPVSGLKMNGDWELVRNNCSACHSTRLITQQNGNADQWLEMIRWMQAEQNLWEFDPETEQRIIGYLAENYPPQARQRRAPIADDLMPPPKHHGGRKGPRGGKGHGGKCQHGQPHEASRECGKDH